MVAWEVNGAVEHMKDRSEGNKSKQNGNHSPMTVKEQIQNKTPAKKAIFNINGRITIKIARDEQMSFCHSQCKKAHMEEGFNVVWTTVEIL